MIYPARIITLSLGLVLTTSLAIGVNLDDAVKEKDSLDKAAEAPFGSVGLIKIVTDSSISYGTGTFIGFGNDSAWVLTAGHVLRTYNKESSFTVGDKSWSFGTFWTSGTYDLGVIQIKGIKAGDLKPATFWSTALPIANKLEDRIVGTGIGFGRSGTGTNPGTANDRKKRAYTNTIDAYNLKRYNGDGSVGQEFTGYMTDFDDSKASGNALDVTDTPNWNMKNQTSSRSLTTLEGNGDSGDSGGPFFVQRGAQWTIAGVFSGTLKRDGYGSLGHYEAMDADTTKNFITKHTGITAVPEPGSFAVLGLGLLALRRRASA